MGGAHGPAYYCQARARFQGRQERGLFEGFLQGFVGAEESRGIKKRSFWQHVKNCKRPVVNTSKS